MISDSDKYVALQNVFKQKAQQDVEAVMTRVERLLLNINKPYDCINENEVKVYCKLCCCFSYNYLEMLKTVLIF